MKAIDSRLAMVGFVVIALAATAATVWRFWPTTSPEDYVQRGFAAINRQDWSDVLASAEGLKGRPPFANQERLFRGVYLLKTGQPAAALSAFSELNPEGEVREPALLFVGEAYYRLGRLSDANRIFATLAAEHPGHADSHRWLAAIAYDLGDFSRALDELAIVIRLSPSDYRPHSLKGQMQFDLEQYRSAIESFSQAIAADPPPDVLEEMRTSLARAQILNREYRAALDTLAAASRSAVNLALEAECQLSLGRESETRKLIAEAEEMDPQQPDMLRTLGRMELDAGHPAAAIEPLRAVLDQSPQDHETRHQLAQALRLSGDAAAAETEARRAAHTIELKAQLAKLTQDAIRQPLNAELRDRMAELCDQLGNPQLAASWRKAAVACREMQPAPRGETTVAP